jgi:hypothetical protein
MIRELAAYSLFLPGVLCDWIKISLAKILIIGNSTPDIIKLHITFHFFDYCLESDTLAQN